MRRNLVYAGLALLILGIVVSALAVVGSGQATEQFMGCLNGVPSNPIGGFPAGCADAMNALVVYSGLEYVGGIVGLVGLVLQVLGIVLEPVRPVPAWVPNQPPPVYGSPYGHAPPQGPQGPPPPP